MAQHDRADGPDGERVLYAEQALYARSPFNLWITTALLYVAMIGLLAMAAMIDGAPYAFPGSVSAADYTAKVGLVLPLIVCAVLCMQRYSRLGELRDAEAFARALKPGVRWQPAFPLARLRLFTGIGAAIGLAVVALAAAQAPDTHRAATLIWFGLLAALLGALFFRGLVLTRSAARHTRQVIETGLDIDLLRIERLYPWGRAAARTSLVWFTVSAATLLLFASTGFSLYSAAILVACAVMGLWVFMGAMSQMHRQIRQAKAVELERLRSEIARLSSRLGADKDAAAQLQGLLAYEARIAATPEWPVDQTMLMRVGVSSLILTVPWFGQAFAGLVVAHLGGG
jgi:hypothetical protein